MSAAGTVCAFCRQKEKETVRGKCTLLGDSASKERDKATQQKEIWVARKQPREKTHTRRGQMTQSDIKQCIHVQRSMTIKSRREKHSASTNGTHDTYA